MSVVTSVSNTGLALLSWVGRRLGNHLVLVFLGLDDRGHDFPATAETVELGDCAEADSFRSVAVAAVPVALGAHNEEAVRRRIPHAGRNLGFLATPLSCCAPTRPSTDDR